MLHVYDGRLEQTARNGPVGESAQAEICAEAASVERDVFPVGEGVIRHSGQIAHAAENVADLAAMLSLTVIRQVEAQRLPAAFGGDFRECSGTLLAGHLSVDEQVNLFRRCAPKQGGNAGNGQ